MAHRLSVQAQRDLSEIWQYIAGESGSHEIARGMIETIANRFWLLSQHPYLGRSREEDLGAGIRSIAVREYVICYCVEDGDVLVLRVIHGRRNLEALFNG